MAIVDTLEILIEADAAGLTSQLKRASSTITSFVSQMNKQEVGWTQILSKSITPALMASIASTFAISIAQAMQFQNAVQASSLSSKNTLADNSSKMSGAIYGMSNSTGKSAIDIADAMGSVQQVYKDTATSQGILNVIAQEASVRNQSVADTAKELIPLFQEWGINSGPQAATAMANINQAVKEGNISYPDLINNLTDAGTALGKYVDLGTAAAGIEIISSKTGMNAKTALTQLQTIVTGIQDPLSQAGILFSDAIAKVKAGDIGGAFGTMDDKIRGAGAAANAIFGATGMVPEAITRIQNLSTETVKSIKAIAPAIDALKAAHSDLQKDVDVNMTSTKELEKIWNQFKNGLATFAIPVALTSLLVLLNSLGTVVDFLGNSFSGKFLDSLKKVGEGISAAFKDPASFMEDIKKQVQGLTGGLLGASLTDQMPALAKLKTPTTSSSQADQSTKLSNSVTQNTTIYNVGNNPASTASTQMTKLPTQLNNSFYGTHSASFQY
jgi:hypothetical protein